MGMVVDLIRWIRGWRASRLAQEVVSPDIAYEQSLYMSAQQEIYNAKNYEDFIELTYSCNGFVRQAALNRLQGYLHEDSLVAIIERLNDWVPEVREAARKRLNDYLVPEGLIIMALNLNILLNLENKSRENHNSLLKKVMGGLDEVSLKPLMIDRLNAFRGRTARRLFEYMLDWQNFSTSELLRLGGQHHDFTLRNLVYRMVRQCLPLAEAREILLAGLQERVPNVRNVALNEWILTEPDPNKVDSVLEKFVLDASPSTRDLALWYARKRGVAIEDFLNQKIKCPPASKRALVGLLGVASRLKLEGALDFAHHMSGHENADVRCAAYIASVRLDESSKRELTYNALRDFSPKVFAVGLSIFREGVPVFRDSELVVLFSWLSDQGFMDRALRLLPRMGLWLHLQCLLDSSIWHQKSDAETQILLWLKRYNRSYSVQPTDTELQKLAQSLSQLGNSEREYLPDYVWNIFLGKVET